MNRTMHVDVFSFGFVRSGIPADASGNGGGFVFDCRFLPNPGLEPAFMHLSGLDQPVIEYLERIPETASFLAGVRAMLDPVVDVYDARGYTHLQVSFGCTGGQHRSVYCAESVARHLRHRGVSVRVTHVERGVYW